MADIIDLEKFKAKNVEELAQFTFKEFVGHIRDYAKFMNDTTELIGALNSKIGQLNHRIDTLEKRILLR